MIRYLKNKVTKELIDLSYCDNNLEAINKACEIFDIPSTKIVYHVDIDEYLKDKNTNAIIINFGIDNWEIHTEKE